jgi:hypothetical protein
MIGIFLLIFRFIMVASLFLFLGFALWTIWADLKKKATQLALPNQSMIELRTIKTREIHPVRPHLSEFELGRDPSCEVHIDDGSISTKHARFSFHHDHWWLEDLKSTNGTFINGEKISNSIIITENDVLKFGKIEMEIAFHPRSK